MERKNPKTLTISLWLLVKIQNKQDGVNYHKIDMFILNFSISLLFSHLIYSGIHSI